MNAVVRTVTGDIPPGELGRTDYHEHLLQVSPLLPGDGLDDVDRSATEAATLRAAGIDALIELTPIGLGRDPAGLRAIAQRSGLRVVMATGVQREAHYPEDHPLHAVTAARLVDRFVGELVDGVTSDGRDGDQPASQRSGATLDGIRAGVIKVGTGYWDISAFEQRNLEAAAAAQQRTGAALVCHLELGSAAFEVLELLVRSGATAERIVLAHADRNPDRGLHLELAATGAYLGYDGAARTKYWPDQVLLDCLVAVAQDGGAERLLLGGDVARRRSFASYGGIPGMAYLPRRFVPRLEQQGGPELVDQILVANPARAFTVAADV